VVWWFGGVGNRGLGNRDVVVWFATEGVLFLQYFLSFGVFLSWYETLGVGKSVKTDRYGELIEYAWIKARWGCFKERRK